MSLEEFIENIRIGVIDGKYDIKFICKILNEYEWYTTRQVPTNQRKWFISKITTG